MHPADVVVIVLGPGDALSIPLGWLHVADATGVSASLTFFWTAWVDAIAMSRHRPTLVPSLALRAVRWEVAIPTR
ncbi:MAG TPA: hypothetical protein VGB14_13985 [Acidimicrobiales bacterium]|jgi:hypothetical protein